MTTVIRISSLLLSLCPTPLSPLFRKTCSFPSDPFPAICFMLWLIYIRTRTYEVPYSPFERFLPMKSSLVCLFFIRSLHPPLQVVCAHGRRLPFTLSDAPLPCLSLSYRKDGTFSFCFFDTDLSLVLRRRRPTHRPALSDIQSNAVFPVAVHFYLDMALFLVPLRIGHSLERCHLIFPGDQLFVIQHTQVEDR